MIAIEKKMMAVLAAGACLASCRKEPLAPLPSSAPEQQTRGLRPMTSRDGAPAPADAAETPGSLPPNHPPLADGAPSVGRPAAGGSISGTVAIGAKLQGRQMGASLFIIARNASKQIIAVRKEQASQFPFAFSISGADAMVQGTAFEGPIDLTARLSRTGDAMPGNGDVEGSARGIAVGSKNVTITLDSVRQ